MIRVPDQGTLVGWQELIPSAVNRYRCMDDTDTYGIRATYINRTSDFICISTVNSGELNDRQIREVTCDYDCDHEYETEVTLITYVIEE